MKSFFSVLILIAVFSACRKEPFDIHPKDCEGVSTAINLAKLEQLKKSAAGKTQFKVGIVADSHTTPQTLSDEIDRLNNRGDIDLVFILGDMSDSGLEMEYDWTCKALQKIKAPFFTAIGNHDAIANGKDIYLKYFGAYNYSFSFLGTKFVFYNDNGFEFPAVPEVDFLKREAQVAAGEVRNHTIGASHVPPRAEAHTQAEIDAFLKSMDSYGYKLTLHGHLHSFVYFKDRYENSHYVVSTTRKNQSGIMTVTPTDITMQNCTNGSCEIAEPVQGEI